MFSSLIPTRLGESSLLATPPRWAMPVGKWKRDNIYRQILESVLLMRVRQGPLDK
jgi:hypothetical protein